MVDHDFFFRSFFDDGIRIRLRPYIRASIEYPPGPAKKKAIVIAASSNGAIQPNLFPCGGSAAVSLINADINWHPATVIETEGVTKPNIRKMLPEISIRPRTR
jgi:hypothetical protein